MKKFLTIFLAVFVSGAFTISAQDPVYIMNWDDTNSETGILSTQLEVVDPGLVVAVDNFVVPEGETWTITELLHRGFVSADDQGTPLAAPDGFSFHIFSDLDGAPDTLVVQETFMDITEFEESVSMVPTETLQLIAGTYWIGFTGYYETAADLTNAGWNIVTWREVTEPLNESVPYLMDEGNLLLLDAEGWEPITALGLAFGALDFALYGTVEQMETFTVTFTVQDQEENALENATIVLGPFTNDQGDYVFEEVPVGTHAYTVSLDDYPDVTGEVEVTDADVEVVVVMVEAGETFAVTFNVNMAGAAAPQPNQEPEVEFDPEVHRVFIAGSFPGDLEWNQPGTNEALEMMPAAEPKLQAIYTQDFEGTTFPPENWTKLNPDGGSGWVSVAAGTSPMPGWESGEVTASPAGGERMAYATWNTGGAAANDQWLISPQLTVVEGAEFSYYLRLGSNSYADNVDVLISTTTNDDPEAFNVVVENHEFATGASTDWEQFTHQLADLVNVDDQIYIAFREHVADNVNDGSAIFLDMFEYSGAEDPGEELIYTITLDLPAGDYMYKYFMVADEPTWDMGEWIGDPNRELTVTADMTVDDVFGQQPATSIEDIVAERGMLVYPNPALTHINVASSQLINEIRIFDLSGRMVFSNTVRDFNAVINVNSFNRGMYFMQVFGEEGVETHKIQVMK